MFFIKNITSRYQKRVKRIRIGASKCSILDFIFGTFYIAPRWKISYNKVVKGDLPVTKEHIR